MLARCHLPRCHLPHLPQLTARCARCRVSPVFCSRYSIYPPPATRYRRHRRTAGCHFVSVDHSDVCSCAILFSHSISSRPISSLSTHHHRPSLTFTAHSPTRLACRGIKRSTRTDSSPSTSPFLLVLIPQNGSRTPHRRGQAHQPVPRPPHPQAHREAVSAAHHACSPHARQSLCSVLGTR